MSERLKLQLGAILDRYDTARSASEAKQREFDEEKALFVREFADLRKRLLRPLFEAAGAMLKERGHAFSIHEEEFAAEAGGKTTEAGIGLRIAPAGLAPAAAADEPLRVLLISTRHYNKTVCIRNGAVPRGGASDGHALAQIDSQLVEDEVLKLVAATVGR